MDKQFLYGNTRKYKKVIQEILVTQVQEIMVIQYKASLKEVVTFTISIYKYCTYTYMVIQKIMVIQG